MYIENTKVFGFESAIFGMRNPLNSWYKSDSDIRIREMTATNPEGFVLGTNDLQLAQRLILAGNEHGKFLRQIQVWCDIEMPRYWWSEFDTYHYNTKNSCSTMHKLFQKEKPITIDMFYCETEYEKLKTYERVVDLNHLRSLWLNATTQEEKDSYLVTAKRILPENFLQMRTVNTNYGELRNIHHQREHHRLKREWQEVFCEWVKSLPYANELIIVK